MSPILQGRIVRLRPAEESDIPALIKIRQAPEVYAQWRGGDDMDAAVREDYAEPDSTGYVIELDGRVAGWVQWQAEDDPDYRHASIDIFLDPALHGRGLGTEAIRVLARHLVRERGHHRIVIDPSVHNHAAIRSYEKVGFRPIGVMRRYERANDGTWRDSLLMDLLAEELA